MSNRGWTTQKMKDVISNPYKVGKSVDNMDDKIGSLGEPATAYFFSTNQYIVINNKTSKVIQISDLNDPAWTIDARIYDIK